MTDLLARILQQQQEAAEQGFDWPDQAPLWDKLAEEVAELRADAHDPQRASEELGDVLFMALNIARHLQLDPARALEGAGARFAERFEHVMAEPSALPPQGHPDRLTVMEMRWQEAKRKP